MEKAPNEFSIIYESDDVLYYLHLDKENQAFSGRMQFHKPLKYLLSLGKSFLTFILMFLFECQLFILFGETANM